MNIIRTVAVALFFFSITFFAFSPSEAIFNSPDENANAVFALSFAEDRMLSVGSPTFQGGVGGGYQIVSDASELKSDWIDLIHPRSTVVVFDRIVPVSFVGLPLAAGLLASILGAWSIVLVTPLLALFAIYAWRAIILKVFKNERLADLSALFLMIHPAFWHYSGRTMMHNVGFVALLIIGLYFFVVRPIRLLKISVTPHSEELQATKNPVVSSVFSQLRTGSFTSFWMGARYFDVIISATSIALALTFRTSEALWVFAVIAILLVWKRATIGWRKVALFIISLALMLTPLLALNDALYGSPWTTGYTVELTATPLDPPLGSGEALDITHPEERSDEGSLADALDAAGIESSRITQITSAAFQILFPFGIHEMNIIRNIWGYGFMLYPWMTALSLLGIIFVFKKREWRSWLVGLIGLSVWLGVVYGSWQFSDNPDASILTIGNSYARYWLPLFVLASVFAAAGIDRIAIFFEKMRFPFARFMPWTVVALAVMFSTRLVIWGVDGFVQTYHSLESFIEKKEVVLEYTPEDSIVIVDMADKYLFPDRNIVTPLRDDSVYAAIPEMIQTTDVYYFGITLPSADIEHLEIVIFADYGLKLEEIVTIGDETLYRFMIL